jgi:hypothetical protein
MGAVRQLHPAARAGCHQNNATMLAEICLQPVDRLAHRAGYRLHHVLNQLFSYQQK